MKTAYASEAPTCAASTDRRAVRTRAALRDADLVISKGLANYETLSGRGQNTYFLFLCKCALEGVDDCKEEVRPNGKAVRESMNGHVAEKRSADVKIKNFVDFVPNLRIVAVRKVENRSVIRLFDFCPVRFLPLVHSFKRIIDTLNEVHIGRIKANGYSVVKTVFF